MAVIHFDSHLDTWNPAQWGGGINKYDEITHGTLLHFAHEEGLLKNDTGIHVGTRAVLFDQTEDLRHDAECGFQSIMATDIDDFGIKAIVQRIKERVGDNPVYVTIDIDVLDPGKQNTVVIRLIRLARLMARCVQPLLPRLVRLRLADGLLANSSPY
jgi:agmatinase